MPRPTKRCIGYARAFGKGPSLKEQVRLLRSVGCHPDEIWKEDTGGRSALELALTQAMAGDVFIVTTMRSFSSLDLTARVLADLQARNIAFRALAEKFDSRAFIAKDVVPLLIRAAATYREAASERILIGLQSAREQGRVGGRRPVLSSEMRAEAERLIARAKHTMAEIASRVGVSRRTLYNEGLTATKENGRPKRG